MEGGVTHELDKITSEASRLEPAAEYLLIKHYFSTVVAQAKNFACGSLSETLATVDMQLATTATEISKARDVLETNVFGPQLQLLKQFHLQVALK